MDKQLVPLRVRTTTERSVELEQDFHTGEEPGRIQIPYDELDIVLRWLQEAKKELEEERAEA